jgi:hypothetical protein
MKKERKRFIVEMIGLTVVIGIVTLGSTKCRPGDAPEPPYTNASYRGPCDALR